MFAYVGCYTTPDRRGTGQGISVYRVDDPAGRWQHVQSLKTYDNPSFLRLSPDRTTLISVHGGRSAISSYAIDWTSGEIALLGQADTQGRNPVDFAFTADGRHVLAAQYSSGSVSLLPMRPSGVPGDAVQQITITGQTGPRGAEQPAPLPHGVTPDPSGRYLLVPDKGLDVVLVYTVEHGVAREVSRAATTPGAGPRHAVFHPRLPVLYVVCELDCSVQVFDWQDGQLTHRGRRAGMAVETPGALAAEIAVSADGRFVYSSNRGDDSIARFAVAADGGLTLCETTRLPGREPRFFAISPSQRQLYVAQQLSDSIVCFDLQDGALTAPRVVAETPTPVAITFFGA